VGWHRVLKRESDKIKTSLDLPVERAGYVFDVVFSETRGSQDFFDVVFSETRGSQEFQEGSQHLLAMLVSRCHQSNARFTPVGQALIGVLKVAKVVLSYRDLSIISVDN